MAENDEFTQGNNDSQESELSETELDAVAGGTGKDSLSDLNTQDMLQLQRTLDQKSQFEQMISNTLKANAQTTGGIISNLKSS